MMEPIPEEDHEALASGSPHHTIYSTSSTPFTSNSKRVVEEKQRMREIYKSEKINTVVSTISKTDLPVSWNMSPTEKVTTVTTTDENILVSPTSQYISFPTHPHNLNQNNEVIIDNSTNNGIGATYNYTYECHYDDPVTSEIESADFSEANDQDIERHYKQTQKVTRVTKVTTTRSVRQIDLSKGDIHFDAEGSPIVDELPSNVDKDSQIDEINRDLSRTYITEKEEYLNDSNSRLSLNLSLTNNFELGSGKITNTSMNDKLPGCPGIPQVTDINSTEVSLIWLRPSFESPNAPIIGYKVEYRRGEDDPWEAAHDDLLVQNECRITNLEPMADYQFRVLAANIHGFGLPSHETPPILLRPKFDSSNRHFDHYQHFNTISDNMGERNNIIECQQPGPPIPIEVNGDTISLEWRPSVSNNISTPISGYIIEYKAKGLGTWMQANDFLIPTHYYTVSNLRPNGEYEFRVIARCVDVYSKPSLSSGLIKIKPTIPTRSGITTYNKSLPVPDQPYVVEAYHDSVLLNVPIPSLETQIPVSQTIEYREIGDPNWYVAKTQQSPPNVLVTNLRPNNSYEFRAFTVSLYDGSRSPSSNKSDAIQLLWSNNSLNNNLRNVPKKPYPPEYVGAESADSLIICWLPAESSLPIQGYEVEFRDYQQDSHNWYKVTDTLITGCKTTVGYLLKHHQYQFRIIAKNAMGFSEPSEPSETITITENGPTTRTDKWISFDGERSLSPIKSPKYVEAERYGTIPLLQDEIIRESPPLPERDDSPPPINRQANVQWRDPTLKEVIDYLSNNDSNIVINASGLLQHLTYNDNVVKEDLRNLGGIPILIRLLGNENFEIVRNSAGCLRNLSYGKENDINKKVIAEYDGIRWLTAAIKNFTNTHVREEATGALWNISSCDELKVSIYNQCAEVIVDTLIIPLSGYKQMLNKQFITIGGNTNHLEENHGRSGNVFRNGVGVLRNISAINSNSRKQLRNSPLLIESLLFYLQNSFNQSSIDNRSVENIVCILRNLSYRVHEEYDGKKHPFVQEYRESGRSSGKRNRERSKSAPSGSPKEKKKSVGLFKKGGKNKKDGGDNKENTGSGVELLWHITIIQLYLRILQETSNSETLEAVSAAIQNLSASEHPNSQYVRTLVRTEKGLPILVELLKVEYEKVVCSVTTALRNLSMDQRNRELIGKYAIKDLLQKIPREDAIQSLNMNENKIAEATIAAVLGILFEIVKYSTEFTKNLHDIGGTERLMVLAKGYPRVSAKICKYTSQLLYTMWQHKDLHEMFKRGGYKEGDFYSGPSTSRNTAREARTLARPIISYGGNKKPHNDNYESDNYAIYDKQNNTPQSARYDYESSSKYENCVNDINSVRSDSKILPKGGKFKKVSGKEPLYTAVQKKDHYYANSPAGDSWV